ncbi:MAG: thermostable hemolysin [Alphaproteobacteria bacterium]
MRVRQVDRHHPKRRLVERHIQAVYRHAYGADVTEFSPLLFAGYHPDGSIACAAGMRTGATSFHSEAYFDLPAEQMIGQALGRPVDRDEILEITTLACAQPGAALGLVSPIIEFGRGDGRKIALFTGTAALRRFLCRARVPITTLMKAERSRIANPEAWGRYYEADPVVCAAADTAWVPTRLVAPRFAGRRKVRFDHGDHRHVSATNA